MPAPTSRATARFHRRYEVVQVQRFFDDTARPVLHGGHAAGEAAEENENWFDSAHLEVSEGHAAARCRPACTAGSHSHSLAALPALLLASCAALRSLRLLRWGERRAACRASCEQCRLHDGLLERHRSGAAQGSTDRAAGAGRKGAGEQGRGGEPRRYGACAWRAPLSGSATHRKQGPAKTTRRRQGVQRGIVHRDHKARASL
jgi:hypothetical protein